MTIKTTCTDIGAKLGSRQYAPLAYHEMCKRGSKMLLEATLRAYAKREESLK